MTNDELGNLYVANLSLQLKCDSCIMSLDCEKECEYFTIKKCVEKQIPKKPQRMTRKINGKPHIHTFCPYCFEHFYKEQTSMWDCLIDKSDNYCRRCGQALDWSD